MKNSLIFYCCFLFCCCQSLKKKSELTLVQDSLRIVESSEQQQTEHFMEMQQLVAENWEGQQLLEIYSAAPYRLHPDSGLLAGAGYLKMRLSAREQANKWLTTTAKSNSNTKGHHHQEEKVKLKQVLKAKQSEKFRVSYIWYILLVACFALFYIIYKRLRLQFWF